jgi:outer membrane protein assembly factor BamB
LDADTGKVNWVHDMKAHMWGSTFVADGKVYVGDEDGDFSVLASSKEKRLISETNLGYPVYGTPVVANGVMYVMNQSYVYAFHDAARAAKDEAPKVEIK